ncbi:MAG: hypothetical protein ACR2PH_08585, partial [Desulfobulbia bacterium]
VPDSARHIGVSESEIRAYFKAIRRTLDASDLAGQAKFLSEYNRYFNDNAVCSYWAAPEQGVRPLTKNSAFG